MFTTYMLIVVNLDNWECDIDKFFKQFVKLIEENDLKVSKN